LSLSLAEYAQILCLSTLAISKDGMLVLSLLGCVVGLETAAVKLGSLSLKLKLHPFEAVAGCTGEDDICLRESRAWITYCDCSIATGSNVLNTDQRVAVPVIVIPCNYVAHF
jgi:hypothetical protein